MKKTTKVQSNCSATRFRRSVMASACVLALGAGGAMAQSSTYTFTPVATQSLSLTTYLMQELNDQINTGVLTATNASTLFTETHTLGVTSPYSVTNNTIQALAWGNKYLNPMPAVAGHLPDVSLGALGTNDTLGMLSGQIQSGAAVTSSVTNGQASIVLTTMAPDVNVLSGNSILATTAINQAEQSATGQLPAAYSSTLVGSIDANSSATTTSTVTGSVAIVNQQTAFMAGAAAGSSAVVSGSSVLLDLNGSTSPISASQTVSNNTIAAQYQANGTTNKFRADAGSAAVTGSVAVSNSQVNVELAPSAALTAAVANSSMTSDLRNGAGVTNLTGPLVMSGNSISATSTGNNATARDSNGNVIAGNSIILADGVDLFGPGSAQVNTLTAASSNLTAQVKADLVLLNGQGNQNTGLNSDVSAGTIRVLGDNVTSTGTLTLNANSVASSVTGNLAASRIQTGASNLTGSVAAANFQANDATTMVATNSGADISANVGSAAGPVGGAITVKGNTVSAASTGSAADTNVALSSINVTLAGTGAGALANTAAFGAVNTTAGVGATATNMQGNYGESTPISATVSGAGIRATFEDQVTLGTRVGVSSGAVSVNDNAITAAGKGNTATTQLALGAPAPGPDTNASGTAAVGNDQFNGNVITGAITDSGIGISALQATDTSLTANGNKLAASGLANGATNTLSASVTNITAGTSAFGSGSAVTDTGAGTSASNAAFAIASGQKNEAPVSSSIAGAVPLVQVDVSGPGSTGVAGRGISVGGNTASSTTTGNQVSNTLDLAGTDVKTATGAAGQVASISNLQQNLQFQVANPASASVGTTASQMMGIVYGGPVLSSNLTVTGNAVDAAVVGNTAGNSLRLAAQGFGGTASAPGASGALASNPGAGTSAVTNEFAVVNRQDDAATSRIATVTNANIGVDTAVGAAALTGANITVASNSTQAGARNNNAVNSVDLLGTASTNLSTGAGLLNEQTSSTPVSASIINAQDRIQAASTVSTSPLSMVQNTIGGLAVGNFADNSVNAKATNLTGNAGIAALNAGSNITTTAGVTTLSANADYAIGNVQNQTGNVTSAVEANMRISFGGTLTSSSTTMSNNSVTSMAQSNSASRNRLTLDSTNVTASAAVASFQNATGAVSATQTTQAPQGSTFGLFGNGGASTDSAPLVVFNNRVLASAGQNETTNELLVAGTTINGRSFNNPSAYVAGTAVATTGTDYSVLNVQSGIGSVGASAQPGLIGTRIQTIGNGAPNSSLTVSGNDVTAKATVNNATNSLLLNALGNASTLNAAGAVNNVQTTTVGTGVVASVGAGAGGPVEIGVGGALPALINATTTTVSNNSLNAIAGGNNATNALEGSAIGTIGAAGGVPGTNPTFAVLNYQSNASTMNASVSSATIGITMGSLNNSNSTVTGNQVLASGYGNTASNSLATSVLTGNANQSSAVLSNTQRNTASVSALVSGVTMGVIGGSSAGSAGVTSGNSSIAQAVGNAAFNTVLAK